ncbi:acetyl-coenzyme A synthetase, partial [bacterium]|nr:acetyl-coenzyme A synthetase [bacterium]
STHVTPATPLAPYVPMPSESPLFLLYTSGTTGKPKGIVHTTGGYLTHALYSTRLVFDLTPQDVFWCTADVGWITGHTYMVYGPLSAGATLLLVEGTPDYPDKDRYWELVDRHGVTVLYTSPTAIRQMMAWGPQYPQRHALATLRLLGSVGEPLNPEAWRWYHGVIGQSRCPIVDTWWQTETGGIMITTLPGYDPMSPGIAGRALPGIEVCMAPHHPDWLGISSPWPAMTRGIWGDMNRFQSTYFDQGTYLSGDGAIAHSPHQWQILGRLDDVLNVAGHRIGTMEIESALVGACGVVEAAAIGIPDAIKGQAIACFVRLGDGAPIPSDADLKTRVASQLGGIARPAHVWVVPDLPKTRSGKIMRRVLKALVMGESPGDVSTLQDPAVVDRIAQVIS